MATQRRPQAGRSAAPDDPAVPASPSLSTRETLDRPFTELGIMFGQALVGQEPVMQALTNLQEIGQRHGCDAIVGVRLMHYATPSGTTVVAYGTGVRFAPQVHGRTELGLAEDETQARADEVHPAT
jgi:hypothetical protein